MRQKSGRPRAFCIPWDKLTHQVTRQRAGTEAVSRSDDGAPITDWSKALVQVVTGQIQPHAGSATWKPEGVLGETTHILFCNMVVAEGSAAAVDIRIGDRLVGPDGLTYRVLFVDNAAGMNHHYEILLATIVPGGV